MNLNLTSFHHHIKCLPLSGIKGNYYKKNVINFGQDDFNVIIVSWGPGAAFPNYNQAVANTRMVGTQVRLVIDMMVRAGAVLDDFHLIGHSLGAHTSGYAGYLLHGQLGRITGQISTKIINGNIYIYIHIFHQNLPTLMPLYQWLNYYFLN